jgi:uncharacterized membrane protein YphA (DoxX/SURF4 family)
MPISVRLGRLLLSFAMVALGVLGVFYADFILEWTPVPAHLPERAVWAYVHGGVLIIAGLSLVLGRAVRLSALSFGAVWLVWALLYVPRVMANWRSAIGGQFEVLAMTSGIFMLVAISEPQARNQTLALIARYSFAVCLLMFGVVHFLYPAGVASWVPRWLPAHLFWAYFTGVAHCAAGLAILSGVLMRLAARLFAIMLSSWVLILHIPRVDAALDDRHEWTTLFIAIALTGIAWIMTGGLASEGTASEAEHAAVVLSPLEPYSDT